MNAILKVTFYHISNGFNRFVCSCYVTGNTE